MSEIADLLTLARDGDKKERKNAVKELGNLDYQYETAMEVLQDLSANDPDKGVRKEAEKSLEKMTNRPTQSAAADEQVEVKDVSELEAGQYDVDSSMSDLQEDRIEKAAEGKGLLVTLIEKGNVKMDSFGNVIENLGATGSVRVRNTGSSNRISGIDLILTGVDSVSSSEGLNESTHIGTLAPGKENRWTRDYRFDKEVEPIKIEQIYEDQETGLSPNFAVEGEVDFHVAITVTNTTNNPIYNVVGKKTINSIATIGSTTNSKGTISTKDSGVEFEIEELGANDSATITINLSADLPEDVPSYQSGELQIEYENREGLLSGLGFSSIDGKSTITKGVSRVQRETEPGFYDCEIQFKNRSEFVYDLNKFSVFAGSLEDQQIVLDWDGSEASEDEREIVPGEAVNFQFVFESPDVSPTFGDYVDFSVQSEFRQITSTTITLPAEDLKFMALEIEKAFMMEGERVLSYEVKSYVETEVPTVVVVRGVGTFPIEALEIKDDVPPGFKPPIEDEIVVTRDNQDVSSTEYDVGVSASENGGYTLSIKLEHLEETSAGGLTDSQEVVVKYVNIAENPEPREEVIKSRASVEGWIYQAPDAKVKAESSLEELEIKVIHVRDNIVIWRTVDPVDYNGGNAYDILLESSNDGTSVANLFIEDLVPTGFSIIESSIESEPDAERTEPKSDPKGSVYGWKFTSVHPGESVNVKFKVNEDNPDADVKELYQSYRA